MDAIQAPMIPIVGDLIRQVPGTISLGQGVVHYGPPPEVLEAVRAALAERSTHQYCSGAGLPALITRIERKLLAENGIDVGRGSRVMVTAGANLAFMHAVMAVTVPGDEVILPVPFYFNHEMAIDMAGCRAVRVATDEGYQLRPDAIRDAITPRTRAVVTISPNNPSGAVYDEASLRAVNAICRERGVYHISDEPYEYFVYPPDLKVGPTLDRHVGRVPGQAVGRVLSDPASPRHISPGSFPDAAGHTISLFSLSKAYGFAGWRVGYLAYPEHLASAMMKSQDTILICPPVASQIAAAAALDVGRSYCEPYIRELREIRDDVVSQLSALAPLASVPAADGAFYCLLRVNVPCDPMTVCERLIREHRVAVIPGPAFGMTGGASFRVAYGALQKATVAEGIGRLVAGLRAIVGAG